MTSLQSPHARRQGKRAISADIFVSACRRLARSCATSCPGLSTHLGCTYLRTPAVAFALFGNHTAPEQNRVNGMRILVAFPRRFGMVGPYCSPGISVFVGHLAQPPRCHIHTDARMHQCVPGDSVAG
ncbi:hypothetical protein XACW160_90085 [Xanthomonas citri pv. citri]|uniref:Uncharacterized protein n=1 Tax=Xanthomonas citri pv. citri TaxID=611301 RepID=A0A0U4YS22_XANCI|nr:hypothetical protein XAC902_110087 [Xanthomonas citri pv. citri]CEE23455.1 hypothetical protein XAC2911_110088 [Xanthomonas citri pv. citri]CEE81143.1 hypothetical protein XACW160_90085 [Xanthomonas citri pv. citri]CEG18956.1 hypothetical protein XAC3562_90087 [Xanthomonas citri pv. citri]CEH45791.1 hypothetical protein XACLD7_1250016 [Xanthomonas citri pv. citri]